jgi:hypothetical protein
VKLYQYWEWSGLVFIPADIETINALIFAWAIHEDRTLSGADLALIHKYYQSQCWIKN